MPLPSLRRTTTLLQEFSIPLIGGVFVALLAANLAPEWYHEVIHGKPLGDWSIFGHEVTTHFLINDVFMVFFFGIAAKEITEACLPGGDLNPIHKALNPLLSTFGGVAGPVGVFFIGLHICYALGIYGPETHGTGLERGWGIPTATDIALAWLVARAVFRTGHPAINFLLLLAVADDAIGLAIIAIFYGDPHNPAQPIFLLLVLAGMVVALGLRLLKVKRWPLYIFTAGPLAWTGLMLAHLHPALALVFIVPFLPAPAHDTGLFVEEDEVDKAGTNQAAAQHMHHSPLHQFEHHLKLPVDLGLFFFAFGNAGVALTGIGPMTWLIFSSLVIGKTVGIVTLGSIARKLGFPLPTGMSGKELIMAGFVAALGLTVALFVAGAAFTTGPLQGEAKMGALFSGFVGVAAILVARAVGIGKRDDAVRQDAVGGAQKTEAALEG